MTPHWQRQRPTERPRHKQWFRSGTGVKEKDIQRIDSRKTDSASDSLIYDAECTRIRTACLLFLFLAGCGTIGRDDAPSSTNRGEAVERTTEKGPVTLVVRAVPREPRLSDLVEMEIVVTAQKDVEIKPPAFGQAVGDFLVRDYSERTDPKSSQYANETHSRRFVYKLEPVHSGIHLIRSMAIEFVDNRPTSEQKGQSSSIESEPIELNITSELGDQTPDLADLESMVPPRPLASTSSWKWWLVGVIAGLVGLGVFLLRRRRTVRLTEPPKQTPEEIAHAAFSALMAENLPAKGLFKEFYLRLTGIVRHFIEGTTGLRAPEQTTEEFLRAIRVKDVFSVERSTRLKEFLEAADMVKYAGQQPDQDQIELSISRAREFVSYKNLISIETVSNPIQEKGS